MVDDALGPVLSVGSETIACAAVEKRNAAGDLKANLPQN